MCHLVIFVVLSTIVIHASATQCERYQSLTFTRWSGVSPERGAPVFVYSASGEEASLPGACVARCRELEDCAAVVVAFSKGSCYGIADSPDIQLKTDNDAAFFKKTCLQLPENCVTRWWALESTPGYYLNSESSNIKVILNTTVQECYEAVLSTDDKQNYRSAQWIQPENSLDIFSLSNVSVGNCIINGEDKFTEPESYRVSNYYTFYVENQCRHDYPKKIDRCSYEEYHNQTLRHVDLTFNNATKDECKSACEAESRFVCRGFTWTLKPKYGALRGLCDLHSEDLITMGSWLLRRVSGATYYRRVLCLNISVECEGAHLTVTYRPRGVFRGRVYVPGQAERCSARPTTPNSAVRLKLPLYGDCDVNFAYAITKSPTGVVNRTMAYAMLMIQNNPIIQTAGDRWVRVGCSPGVPPREYTKVDATVSVHDSGPSMASEWALAEGAASAVFGAGGAPLSMYVVRAQGDGRPDAVSLGEPLEMRIDTTDEAEIEAYHLVASSRLGDSSVLLLDSKGCPTGQVDFPSFTRSYMSGTQRLSARFKAFRFPSSKVVRFALVVRFCDGKCEPVNCGYKQARAARGTNDTYSVSDGDPAEVQEEPELWTAGVVAQGGSSPCFLGGAPGGSGRVPLELEMVVGGSYIMSADTLVRADHRAASPEDTLAASTVGTTDTAVVCVHELLLAALALAWLAVQLALLLGCCVLVKRYRNLAEMSMQKDYHSFDNVGFETVSTHRRVHWPDQNIDMLHGT